MALSRSHRAQMSFPIHFTAPDRSKTYIGETIDIASTGFSVQVKTEEPLPATILAGILPSQVAGDAILCKARMVWQGGITQGLGRASYKITSIAQKSQERLDQLIQNSLLELIEQLQESPTFQECDRADLEVLLGLARTRGAAVRQVLFEAGREERAGVYIILDGDVSVAPPQGEAVPYGPGSVIGRWTGPEPLVNEETATALGDVRFLCVPLALIPEVQQRAPVIASLLFGALGQVPPRSTRHGSRRRRHLMRINLPHELQEIPTLPSVFNAVMDCIENPDSTPKDLARILRKDQSLTAKILKTINSALYSFARTITSVDEAVVLLGMQHTANLAITAMLLNTLVDENDSTRRPEQFWEHTLGTAYFAHLLGKRVHHNARTAAPAVVSAQVRGQEQAPSASAGQGTATPTRRTPMFQAGRRTGGIDKLDRLFTYAVLHDIGLVVLFLKFPDYFSMVRDGIEKFGELHLAELELLETDHCQLGYRVARAWHLPEPIPTIIAEHHLPQVWARQLQDRDELLALLREEPVVTLISLADLLARHCEIGVELDFEPPEIPPILLEALGLTSEDAEELVAEGPAIREKAEAFFRGVSV